MLLLPVALVVVMPASNVRLLPVKKLRRYPLPLSRIEWKSVPAGKLLKFVSRAAPAGKTRSSPDTGASSPTQLAAVIQLPSTVLPPSQMRVVEGSEPSSRKSTLPLDRDL